jgi:hypothetical protein
MYKTEVSVPSATKLEFKGKNGGKVVMELNSDKVNNEGKIVVIEKPILQLLHDVKFYPIFMKMMKKK